MRSTRDAGWFGPGLVACSAIVALVAIAPEVAIAGCGGDRETRIDAASAFHHLRPEPIRDGTIPTCDGPNCSRGPDVPLSILDETPIASEPLADLSTCGPRNGPRCFSRSIPSDAARPIRRNTAVFHPPR